MSILDAAVAYCRAGLAVLPAHPTRKIPLAGKGQHGKNAPFPPEEQVRIQCAHAAAICILCGDVSGNVECVDFDDGGSAYPAWRERLNTTAPGLLDRLVIERSPSGGVHVVYRCTEPIPGSQILAEGAAKELLIETRGNGALFLCDPTPGYKLVQGAFAELPTITTEEREIIITTARSLNTAPTPASSSAPERPSAGVSVSSVAPVYPLTGYSPYVTKALQDEAAKVRTCPPGGRNRALNTAAMKIGHYVASGLIPQEPVYAALEAAALDAGLNASEIRPTIHSGLTAGARDPRTLPLRPEPSSDVDLSKLVQRVERVAEGLPPVDPILLNGEIDDDDPAEDMSDVPIDPDALPDDFYRIPGFIAEVMDFTLECAPIPNPVLAFCGALVLQAHLAGRKVRDSSDVRTNLYLIALADSTSGKDFPRKVNNRILHEIGASRQIAGKFATGEGLQDSLFIEPAMLYQTDEIASLFIQLAKSKDARHEAAMQELLSIYTSADNYYQLRKKAGQDKNAPVLEIDQPHLTVLGSAPSDELYQALSPRMLRNGLFGRMLIVDGERPIHSGKQKIRAIPSSIIEAARWWLAYKPTERTIGNLIELHPEPTIVPETPSAADIFTAWTQALDAQRNAAKERGFKAKASLLGRAHENGRKLALLHAVSANPARPEIDAVAAEWAVRFVRNQTAKMLFMAHLHVADNDVHAAKQDILRLLESAPDHTLTKNQLTRMTRGLRLREREELLADLTTGNLIRMSRVLTGGRPRELIQLKKCR